jgi:segregation and condensation protein B
LTSQERRDSLADQAAAWVPPWARERQPAESSEPGPAGEPQPAEVAHAEAESAEPVADQPVEADEPAEVWPAEYRPAEAENAEPQTAAVEPAAVVPETLDESEAVADREVLADRDAVADGEVVADRDAVADGEVVADGNAVADGEVVADGNAVADREVVAERDVVADPDAVRALGLLAEPGSDRGEPAGPTVVADPGPGRRSVAAAAPAAKLALLDEDELHGALEAILLVVDEPVAETVLAQVLEQPVDRVGAALVRIAQGYTEAGHGFELRRAAGGWRLYTRPEYAGYVERFVLDGQSVRLTQAALETLAVVAYKQPVTRSRISAIRGVNCDGVIRTLISRGLVEECGTEPDSGAHLYRTTILFLEKLGLDTVDELPPLAPFLPDDLEELTDAPR